MIKEYYSGNNSVADFLRPSADRYIPLVELPAQLNPYLEKYDIHIDAKLMNTLPLGNVKSIPAWHMLAKTPDIDGKTIVEASSGNTVTSLGLMAPLFGAAKVHAIASPEVSEGKLTLLQLAGVTVELVKGPICPNPNDPRGAIAAAKQKGSRAGHINLNQYTNHLNPAAHEMITGPQLHDQLGDSIGMFCAGLGTTGTLLGTATYLHSKIPTLKVGGIIRKPNNAIPGVRTKNGLNEVDFEWMTILTEDTVEIGQKESYLHSLHLIRAGLMVGPSSGFAFAGTLAHLRQLEQTGAIEQLRGKHVVFICPDSPLPYLSDYKTTLDASHFPLIINEHLITQDNSPTAKPAPTINVEELFDSKDTFTLIDVREPNEFEDHHIEGSTNIPLGEINDWINTRGFNDQIVFVCRSGNRSGKATVAAIEAGLDARNLSGGMIEWSDKNLPRITSLRCR